MFTSTLTSRLAAATIAIAGFVTPVASLAQDAAQAPTPAYARPAAPSDEDVIRGRVASFDGKYGLSVRDDRGFVDNVSLHQGTIINPTGLQLRPGMSVAIHGYANGGTFAANEVDTPYADAYAYGYGAYGGYGYGSAFVFAPSFGFGFGGHGRFR